MASLLILIMPIVVLGLTALALMLDRARPQSSIRGRMA